MNCTSNLCITSVTIDIYVRFYVCKSSLPAAAAAVGVARPSQAMFTLSRVPLDNVNVVLNEPIKRQRKRFN